MANKIQTLIIPFFKVDIEILNDSKIKLLRKMPEGDTLLVLWIGLLSLAMKADDPGTVELGKGIPFTAEMLSAELDIKITTVRMGLETFQKLRMVDMLDADTIYITNFEKHQALDKIRSNREATRKRVASHRQRVKSIAQNNSNGYNDDCNANVTNDVTNQSKNSNGTEENLIEFNRIDINREEKEYTRDERFPPPPPLEKITKDSEFETDTGKYNIDSMISVWNSLNNLPLFRGTSLNLKDPAEVYKSISLYSQAEVIKAIENIDGCWNLTDEHKPGGIEKFLINSLNRWVDEVKPFDRYKSSKKKERGVDFE